MTESRMKRIGIELIHHTPYSIFGVTLALMAMGVLNYFGHLLQAEGELTHASAELFHVFHAVHVLISAVATTAMFLKHDNRNIFKAFVIGLIGSVTICGVSDIFVPYVGGMILGTEMHWHICLLEEPMLVVPFALVGSLAGLAVTKAFEKSTQYSHGMHVFISSVASLLYLIAFGLTDWVHVLGGVFMVTVVAVMFPCCLSDIVFPMLCTHKYCSHSTDESYHCHH